MPISQRRLRFSPIILLDTFVGLLGQLILVPTWSILRLDSARTLLFSDVIIIEISRQRKQITICHTVERPHPVSEPLRKKKQGVCLADHSGLERPP